MQAAKDRGLDVADVPMVRVVSLRDSRGIPTQK